MNRTKLITLVLICCVVGIVILQNRAPVKTELLFASVEMPLILLLSLTALAGFVVGLLAPTLLKTSSKK